MAAGTAPAAHFQSVRQHHETMVQVDEHWLARLNALGRAQSRYLWILLVACLFYAALRTATQASVDPNDPGLQVPIVDLTLNPKIVLALGCVVISFLVMAITGSLRAYSNARSNLGAGSGADYKAESFDTSPNAIDLAVYTTKDSPRWLAVIAYFTYPAVLTLALFEGAILAYDLINGPLKSIAGRWWFVGAGGILWILAVWQVVTIVIGRIHNVHKLRKPGAA